MFFKRFRQKTIKELRKNQSLTATELAFIAKVNTSLIVKIDDRPLKSIPEPLRSRIEPVLKGKRVKKNPWL